MEPSGTSDSQQLSFSKVRVVVRVRPFLPQEISAGSGRSESCVSVLEQANFPDDEVTVFLKDQFTSFSRTECYKLDSFYGGDDNNVKRIFDREVKPMIPGIFKGCNATVFAYGATGSGKTYTMQGTDGLPGLMSSAMSVILSMCERTGSTAEISYYEVYMDKCYDLLDEKPKEIAIMDDGDGKIHLRGLSRVSVSSMSNFNETFSTGVQKRKVANTWLNDVSIRSHGAVVISVTAPSSDSSESTVIGKLNMIDLAGNEDNKKSCNDGIRIQESGKINQSLFALSNVIYALNNKKSRVPYRESKLTRILQDSLGGTSRALMVACLNPGEYQESVHTVSLAARSRHVSNFVPSAQKQETPKLRVDMKAKLRAWLESRRKAKSSNRFLAFGSPTPSKCPNSARTVKRTSVDCQSSVKTKTSARANVGASITKRVSFVPCRNLFDSEGLGESCSQNLHSISVDQKMDNLHLISDEQKQENLHSCMLLENQEMNDDKTQALTPLRKALHPINGVLNQEALAGFVEDDSCPYSERKSPVSVKNCATPLNKFNECSTNLKANLVKEYMDFLNVASREELLELKGIGPKRAEYIIEARESSPLKSLDDLEKIGLSSKQAQDLLWRAARSEFA